MRNSIFGTEGRDVALTRGTAGDDRIEGFGGDDVLRGLRGDDLLIGGDGNDRIIGGRGFDTVAFNGFTSVFANGGGVIVDLSGAGGRGFTEALIDFDGDGVADEIDTVRVGGGNGVEAFIGGDGDDRFTGSARDDDFAGAAGDDRFIGSDGSDRFDGGDGVDTVDYSALGQAVTLRAAGLIAKSGGGIDRITGIERIVGDAASINVIDGSPTGISPVSFRVAFGEGLLEIRDIPGFGTQVFEIENFANVVGTQNADEIDVSGVAGATVFGSLGDDRITGDDDGFVVDYSGFEGVITLQTAGLVQKGAVAGFGPNFSGALGTDRIGAFSQDPADFVSARKVIGAAGRINTIDGTSRSGAVNVRVDLAAGTFESEVVEVVGNFPNFAPGIVFGFEIENFVNVVGTVNDDSIKGDDGDNTIFGSRGSDRLQAGDSFVANGFDVLDYGELDGSVEVAAAGLFTKREADGALIGVDTVGDFDAAAGRIDVFERVIGDEGFANTLNGAGEFASVDIDLGAGTILATVGQGGFGGFDQGDSFGFEVINFVNAIGSDLDDSIVGDAGDNTIFGSRGSDVLRAGASFTENGFDTLDYSGLGGSVEVAAAGVFTKREADGALIGVDTVGDFDAAFGQIDVFERVIGAEGFANTLNGAGAFASVDIDLGAGTILATVGQGGFGGFDKGDTFGFEAINFVNAVGSDLDDVIIGDTGSNVIDAGAGRDLVSGGGGADTFAFNVVSGRADASDPRAFTRVVDFGADDFLSIETLGVFDAITVFEAAQANTTQGGVNARLNANGSRIVLRTDGDDAGSEIDNGEIFARLIIDPAEFGVA